MGIKKSLTSWFTRWLNKERAPETILLSDFEALCYSIRPCDILLVEGRSNVADIIKTITQSKWTHAGMYIGSIASQSNPEHQEILRQNYQGSEHDALIVEGILGKGTIVTNLEDYRPDNLRLCRPAMLSSKDAAEVIDFIISRVGSPYDFRQMLDLARFLFPWSILPRRWRSTLFTLKESDSTKAVCSTTIAEAFNQVSYPILPKARELNGDKIELLFRNPRLYTPADYDYSPFFEVIKFPKNQFSMEPAYRHLPWNKKILSNDEDFS